MKNCLCVEHLQKTTIKVVKGIINRLRKWNKNDLLLNFYTGWSKGDEN